jgi:hypothetical protein
MGVFSAWALAIGLQTLRDVRQGHAPLPSEFVASGVAFGTFSVVGQAAPGVGAALSWGLLVAIALQAYTKYPKLTQAVAPESKGCPAGAFPWGNPGIIASLTPGKVKCSSDGKAVAA